MVKNEIAITQKALEPSGPRAAAVILDKTLAHFGLPDNWESLAPDYMDELSQIPEDLLPEIWIYVRINCKFWPKIADLLETVRDKLSARNIKLLRLNRMVLAINSGK